MQLRPKLWLLKGRKLPSRALQHASSLTSLTKVESVVRESTCVTLVFELIRFLPVRKERWLQMQLACRNPSFRRKIAGIGTSYLLLDLFLR